MCKLQTSEVQIAELYVPHSLASQESALMFLRHTLGHLNICAYTSNLTKTNSDLRHGDACAIQGFALELRRRTLSPNYPDVATSSRIFELQTRWKRYPRNSLYSWVFHGISSSTAVVSSASECYRVQGKPHRKHENECTKRFWILRFVQQIVTDILTLRLLFFSMCTPTANPSFSSLHAWHWTSPCLCIHLIAATKTDANITNCCYRRGVIAGLAVHQSETE